MLVIAGGILLAVLILFALFCLTDQDACPIGIWILVILGVAFFASSAFADEYITPEIPSEEMKVEALKLGYIANGFSMDGKMEGSIDVSQAFKVYPPPPPAPPDPPAPKKKR